MSWLSRRVDVRKRVPVLKVPPPPPPPPYIPGPSGGRLLCGQYLGDGITCQVAAGGEHVHVGGLRRYLDPSPAEVDDDVRRMVEHPVGAPKADPECISPEPAPVVDFRAMLGDDSPAWSVRSRLEAVLGRPHLATQLADALPHEMAARLCDRLETLVSQAVSEAEMRINVEVATLTSETATRLKAEVEAARIKLRGELHGERFGHHSRLS